MTLRRSFFALAVAAATLLAFLAGNSRPFVAVENGLYDVRAPGIFTGQRDPRIVVVGLDDASLEKVGPWPWPRSVHGRLVRALKARGARLVFFDVLFADPGAAGPEDDAEFARALREAGNVVLGGRVDIATTGRLQPPEILALLQQAAPLAALNCRQDPDSVVRWGMLGLVGEDLPAPVPAAAMDLFARMHGIPPGEVAFGNGEVRAGSFAFPTTGRFPHDLPITFRIRPAPVPYHEVLEAPTDRRDLEGAIVLVGWATSDAAVDTFLTPTGPIKGVEIHAALLDTLLSGRILRRVPAAWDLLAALLVSLAVGAVFQRFRAVGVGLVAAVVVGGAYVGANLALFQAGFWLSLTVPLLAAVFTPVTFGVARYVQARSLFGQFVAGRKVDEMLLDDAAAELGGEEQEATVFFTDIRGYTTLSESRRPLEVMDILNQYHSRVGEIYARRGGQVMTYQGDAQIVLFGYRERGFRARPGEAVVSAVQAGLEMQSAVEELRQKWEMRAGERFEVGVGICTGKVSVAVVGSEGHKQHTVLGDVVRFASEVQGMSATLDAPVIMDEASFQAATGRVKADALEPVTLKGQPEPVRLYRATGVG